MVAREARGGSTRTHRSPSETRQTRLSDPYPPEHRVGPSPLKTPRLRPSTVQNPHAVAEPVHFDRKWSFRMWWLSRWKLGPLTDRVAPQVVTSPPTSSSFCEPLKNVSYSAVQIKGAALGQRVSGSGTSRHNFTLTKIDWNNKHIPNRYTFLHFFSKLIKIIPRNVVSFSRHQLSLVVIGIK